MTQQTKLFIEIFKFFWRTLVVFPAGFLLFIVWGILKFGAFLIGKEKPKKIAKYFEKFISFLWLGK
jgi:hypothetical protein